jgi:hypothetical protein
MTMERKGRNLSGWLGCRNPQIQKKIGRLTVWFCGALICSKKGYLRYKYPIECIMHYSPARGMKSLPYIDIIVSQLTNMSYQLSYHYLYNP